MSSSGCFSGSIILAVRPHVTIQWSHCHCLACSSFVACIRLGFLCSVCFPACLLIAGFSFGLFVHPEAGGSMLLSDIQITQCYSPGDRTLWHLYLFLYHLISLAGYPEFGFHLNQTGRPMIYSCSWPVYQIYSGMSVSFLNFGKYCKSGFWWLVSQSKYPMELCLEQLLQMSVSMHAK
jgi:hypothetical protein